MSLSWELPDDKPVVGKMVIFLSLFRQDPVKIYCFLIYLRKNYVFNDSIQSGAEK